MLQPSPLRDLFSAFFVVLLGVAVVRAAAEEKTLPQFLQERGYEPIKLQRLHANHLLALGQIGGGKVRCLLDTGAALTLVDKRVSAGWPPVDKLDRSMHDALGKDVSGRDVFVMQNLHIGRCAFPEHPVVAVEMRPDPRKDQPRTGSLIPRGYERLEFEVVLGLDFLRRHHALIDCHGATVYIRPDPPAEALAASVDESFRRSGYSVVPLTGSNSPSLGVDGSIGGSPVQLIVDTGAWVTTLDRREAKGLGLKVQDLSAKTVSASGAQADIDMIRLSTLKLGSYEVPPVRVGTASIHLTPEKSATAQGSRVVGLLGPEVLAFNGGIIDCHGAKMYLKAMEQPSGEKK